MANLDNRPDPRHRQRAARIADWAISPFLTARARRTGQASGFPIAMADLGGGSMNLLSSICKRLVSHHPQVAQERDFQWTIVDLATQDPASRTASPRLRCQMRYAEYVPIDYRKWIEQQAIESASDTWDVILLCRVLNNESLFSIQQTRDPDEIRILAGRAEDSTHNIADRCCPHRCLDEVMPRTNDLIASNAKVSIRGGRSFRQVSASLYFELLDRATRSGISDAHGGTRSVFFPLRSFSRESLLLRDGSSMIGHLARLGRLLVIEDVDLNASALREHLASHRLTDIVAADVTDRARMQLGSLLCVAPKEEAACLPGRRIW
jgi:hypothetical protein